MCPGRRYGFGLFALTALTFLGACSLLSGVDDLHLANPSDGGGGTYFDGASDGARPDAPPKADGAGPLQDAADGGDAADGTGPSLDASDGGDAADVFVPVGAGDAGQGRPGIDAVIGGSVLHSSGHTLILSLGEAPGGNGVATSTAHRLVGGVVGTTQH